MYDYSPLMGFGTAGIAILSCYLNHIAGFLEEKIELRLMKVAILSVFEVSEGFLGHAPLSFVWGNIMVYDFLL